MSRILNKTIRIILAIGVYGFAINLMETNFWKGIFIAVLIILGNTIQNDSLGGNPEQ